MYPDLVQGALPVSTAYAQYKSSEQAPSSHESTLADYVYNHLTSCCIMPEPAVGRYSDEDAMGQFLRNHVAQYVSGSVSHGEDRPFPLHHAIRANSGAVERPEELIRKAIREACPQTAEKSLEHLYEALGRKPVELIELLLGAGRVNTNDPDRDMRTPLSYAAGFGDAKTVKHLLGMDTVDTNTPDDHGKTPLSYAALYGHTEVVMLLLDTGKVNINAPDDDGQTPLSYAVERNHVEVVSLLQDALGGERKPGVAGSLSDAANEDPVQAPHGAKLEDVFRAFQGGNISTSQEIIDELLNQSRFV